MVTDIPVRVASTVPFRHFATGLYHSCASDSDGLGSCWGYNTDGSLGLGTADSLTGSSSTPRRINSSAYLTALAVGDAHTCALTSAGEALCWGAGADGQRGDSTAGWARNDPTFAATTTRFTRIAAGASSTCALESGTGAAWCWGENSNGQLGDGTTFDRLAPTKVLGGLSFTSLSMLGGSGGSDNFAPGPICAGGAGRMYCWGLLPQPLTFEE
jgi:alpha-tubulin suppressor-like RCC1 family protein